MRDGTVSRDNRGVDAVEADLNRSLAKALGVDVKKILDAAAPVPKPEPAIAAGTKRDSKRTPKRKPKKTETKKRTGVTKRAVRETETPVAETEAPNGETRPLQPGDTARCIRCNCTDSQACAGGCSWVWRKRRKQIGLCTACATPEEMIARTAHLAGEGPTPQPAAGEA